MLRGGRHHAEQCANSTNAAKFTPRMVQRDCGSLDYSDNGIIIALVIQAASLVRPFFMEVEVAGTKQHDKIDSQAGPSDRAAATQATQRVLTPLSLKFYDAFVLGFSSPLLWRCPASALQELYDRNISANHLDIGVGTGYFLDHAKWCAGPINLTLMDINEPCLDMVSRRLLRMQPKRLVADVLDPLPETGPFESISLTHVLHCLPGDMRTKSRVFDNLRPVLAPDGRLFGATIVQGDAPRSRAAQGLMNFYNARRIFTNKRDCAEDLQEMLSSRFEDVAVTLMGCVAIFEARAAG